MSTRTDAVWAIVALALMIVAGASGCATKAPSDRYEPSSAAGRNPLEAQRLTQEAASLMRSDPVAAERLLGEALQADLYHGPAHNNLGVLYLDSGRLYEAAGEFEWARKLMPGHPDPRLNLALVLEQAGRIDDAIAGCRAALEVYPGHLPSTQTLASLQVRHSRATAETEALLDDIAARADASWRDWAIRQRLRLARK